jgi:hypothetical protein
VTTMNIRYNLEEWQLFINSSMHSLKALLLHEGNILPSIPVACVIHKKEMYENMKKILSRMNYKTYECHICSNLKVVTTLTGLQKSYSILISGELYSQ